MKEIKKILFLHEDDHSLNPLFKAIFEQAVLSDSVLSTAGLRVDSAEISFPNTRPTEGKQPPLGVQFALDSLGFRSSSYESKHIKLHPQLIHWADVILVPDVGVEDLLCLFSHDAWSKTIPIDTLCRKKYAGYDLFSAGKAETKEDYLSVATTFKMLLPDIIERIKDSYASHQLVKGKVLNKKLRATVIGNASVVRRGSDLLNFTMGNILVADRLGAVLQSDVNEDVAMSVIKKLIKSPEFYDSKLAQIKDQVEQFEAKMTPLKSRGKTTSKSEEATVSESEIKKKASTAKVEKFFPDAQNAVALVAKNAKAVVCSRGWGWAVFEVPYLYSCVGATERIKDNQFIIVDSTRGEVYDAVTLRGD